MNIYLPPFLYIFHGKNRFQFGSTVVVVLFWICLIASMKVRKRKMIVDTAATSSFALYRRCLREILVFWASVTLQHTYTKPAGEFGFDVAQRRAF